MNSEDGGPAASGTPAEWLAAAFDLPRAHGAPLSRGVLKSSAGDFVVEEDLGFEPDGEGEHLLLRVRKRNANTEWVGGLLARSAGVRPGEVGFAGMKDRHALTTQWFSVPAGKRGEWWRELSHPDVEVLEAHAHRRKLRRGALRGNRFRIVIREAAVDRDALDERVLSIRARGIPNYFGPQRFGRNASNLHNAYQWASRGRVLQGRSARSFVLSAGRSLVFNAVLSERVRLGTWDALQPGDVANLDGTGSIFDARTVTSELIERTLRQDIHPTAPLWGRGELRSAGGVHELEAGIARRFEPLPGALASAGLEQERRSLRVRVQSLEAHLEADVLELRFALPAGAFATMVAREFVETNADGQRGEDNA